MRFALCNEVVRTIEFAKQCELAATLGYDGIEVAPFTFGEEPHLLSAQTIAARRRAATDAGIEISGLHWLLIKPDGLNLTSSDTNVRALTLDVMLRMVDLCAELGGTYLVHGSPAQRQLPEDNAAQARGWVEAALYSAGRAATNAGVVYCVEPLAPRLTNCFNTVAAAAEFVMRSRLRGLRTMLDTSAVRLGETRSPEELLTQWLPSGLIAHIHFNDANQRGPGQGDDCFAPVMRVLHAHRWRGWIGIEPFSYVPDGPGSAARAIGYVRGIEETLE